MPEWVEKVWGKEEIIVNGPLYCGKILHLKKGAKSSLHCHKLKTETFYILEGLVIIELLSGIITSENEEILQVTGLSYKSGESQEIPPGVYHRFYGIENSKIIEFSTPHSDSDVFRKEASQAPGL